MVHIPCVTNVSLRRAERADLADSGRAAQIVGADRAGYGVAPIDDQERRALGADPLGLALVVFDLATVAPGCPDLAAPSELGRLRQRRMGWGFDSGSVPFNWAHC